MRTAPDKPFINYGDTLFTIGVPGSGKTYTQELLIHRLSERNSRTNVLILTPHCAHEYPYERVIKPPGSVKRFSE